MLNGNMSREDSKSASVVGKVNYYLWVEDWFSLIHY
jgi:hypothetical protein